MQLRDENGRRIIFKGSLYKDDIDITAEKNINRY